MPFNEVETLFKDLDQDESGFVDYGEFITAAMDQKVLLSRQKLRAVFNKLDKDKSGTIDINEIKEMFKFHAMSDKMLQNIMNLYD